MVNDKVKSKVIGVNIDSSTTAIAVVDLRGNILAQDYIPTQDYPNVNNFVEVLSERVITLAENNGGYENIRSVGMCAPSANYITGCIVNSPNMPWKGVIPLAAMMRDQLGLAVALANNSHVVALGEHAFGSAHGMRDFIAVTLGSGLGSCIFSDGDVNLGFNGHAGEIGHTCVDIHGRQCGCGNCGCLEAYTATKGIIRTAKELLEESDEPSLMRGEEKLTPKKISQFCDAGDKLAIEVFRRTGEVLGLGLANYASLAKATASPNWSRSIAAKGTTPFHFKLAAFSMHWLLEPAKKSFEEHVFHNIQGKVKFLQSELGEDERNVLGASVLAWRVKEYSLFID